MLSNESGGVKLTLEQRLLDYEARLNKYEKQQEDLKIMSKKKETITISIKPDQKYFVGNFVRHKKGGWTGVICSKYYEDDDENCESWEVYGIAKFNFFEANTLSSTEKIYIFLDGEDIAEQFDIIPYPWQEFFKVGDKVEVRKGAREGRKGTISDIDPDCVWPVSVVSKKEKWMDGYSYADLIKVGEP